jgi:predicted histone-like DNA-binding protein
MGTIQVKKYGRKVTIGKVGQERQKVEKTYGKIIYRGTLKLNDMAAHIMKHGSVYTEDVVLGVITKLKNCMQEMLAEGYKVKLDGIGTLYPVLTSQGVEDAKDFSAQENITRIGVAFLADQSKKSIYKASAMRNDTTLSTKLYQELVEGDDENPSGNSGNGGNGGASTPGTDGNGGGSSTGSDTNGGNSGSNGGSSQGGSSTSGTPVLTISKTGSGSASVTAGGNMVNSGASISEDTQVSITITPATGMTPSATINGNNVSLTEDSGTYSGSFAMPGTNAALMINTGSSGDGDTN